MKMLLTNFSIRHPWLVILASLAMTVLFALQFPKVKFDNDPENMLSADEPVRLYHHEVKEAYALYDFVIVGVVNEAHPDGVFNVETLGRIARLTEELESLHRDSNGLPVVTYEGSSRSIDMTPQSAWTRVLQSAFRHDPNGLFDETGQSALIAREMLSPSRVDNIRQAELGSLRIEYLMEQPPQTAEEARRIRDDALANPLYNGTLVAQDGKALIVYLPIKAKHFSYNLSSLVKTLTADWPETILITGMPVAEDTFGVEMLIQMATSAPMAGLAIFILLFIFFRRVSIISAPMILAVVSVVCTMGLLIGLGFDVHIMSSMIAIFLMPIAVADSVHVLSEFYDRYHQFRDKAKTLQHVVGHLFRPMLYTSLTTIAGFASLAATPIPPVQVFGLHVAFGVGLAWLLTMTLIPAYIMVAIPDSSLEKLASRGQSPGATGLFGRFLRSVGAFSARRYPLVIATAAGIILVSLMGVSRIQVNDNPVKWFQQDHEIRQADRILNQHFGGTYTAYLNLQARPSQGDCDQARTQVAEAILGELAPYRPDASRLFLTELGRLPMASSGAAQGCLGPVMELAASIDAGHEGLWNQLADEINYLDPADLKLNTLPESLSMELARSAELRVLMDQLSTLPHLEGAELQEQALSLADEHSKLNLSTITARIETEVQAPAFKRPELLLYLEELQRHLEDNPMVGKTSSLVDALKKASFELNFQPDARDDRNQSFFSVPQSAAAAGQVFTQLEGMKKKDSLFHLVTRDYQNANLWVQLRSGDNRDMEQVVGDLSRYMTQNPPPANIQADWAGLTYLNVVWQEKMVTGMLSSLGSSFIVVLVMMILLFRSIVFGVLAMLPLSITILCIYGIIGWVGKDYDMPIAVLSSLTLGLSIDFAIHFLSRSRELQKELGSWQAALGEMFKEPATAISRNAVVISIGFTPLLFAPLVPYNTVGFFIATIMAVSWLATLMLLPALMTGLRHRLFSEEASIESSNSAGALDNAREGVNP